MGSKSNALVVILIIAVLGIGGYYFALKPDQQQSKDQEEDGGNEHHHHHGHDEFVIILPEQLEAAGIGIATANHGVLVKEIQSPGKIAVNADRLAHIYPKVPGIAKEAKKNMGEPVEAGEVLAIIESRDIAEAKAAYLTALVKRDASLAQLEQEKNLQEKRITSLQDFQTALASSDSAEIELELAKQKLFANGLSEVEIAQLPDISPAQLRLYVLRAPFKAVVLHRHITPGELLTTENEVYVIADLSNLWVEISIYPQDLPYVHKGQSVKLTDAAGRSALATIAYLSPVIDDETRRSQAIAILDNPAGEWHAGTFVTATIQSDRIPVSLAVTKEAIQKIDGQDCAFIATDKGFEIRPVRTGRCDSKNVEILSGIQKGEKYASKNTFLLKAEHEKDEAEHTH